MTGHTRTPTNDGPDFCDECSHAADNWVSWPCPAVARFDRGQVGRVATVPDARGARVVTGAELTAMRDALLDVIGPLLRARGTLEVDAPPVGPVVAARLLEVAARRLAAVRAMPGLPVVTDGGES